MSDFFQGGEMTEDSLKANFGSLVEQALVAISMDNSYATALALKARSIETRRSRRDQRLSL